MTWGQGQSWPPGSSSLLPVSTHSLAVPTGMSAALRTLHAWLGVPEEDALIGLMREDEQGFAQATAGRGHYCASGCRGEAGRAVWDEAALSCTELPPFFLGTLLRPPVLYAHRGEWELIDEILLYFLWKSCVRKQYNIILHSSLHLPIYIGECFPQPLSEPLWRTDLITTWDM